MAEIITDNFGDTMFNLGAANFDSYFPDNTNFQIIKDSILEFFRDDDEEELPIVPDYEEEFDYEDSIEVAVDIWYSINDEIYLDEELADVLDSFIGEWFTEEEFENYIIQNIAKGIDVAAGVEESDNA